MKSVHPFFYLSFLICTTVCNYLHFLYNFLLHLYTIFIVTRKKMEITKLFKAYVKTVSMKTNKSSNILPKKTFGKSEDSFNKKALQVVENITKLRDFLLKYQTAYLSRYSHITTSGTRLSDEDREQIDADAQVFMKSCTSAIVALIQQANSESESQSKLHSQAVGELLQMYLNSVCKLYSQQRAFRIKQAVDKRGMSRLTSIQRKAENPVEEESREKPKQISKMKTSKAKPTGTPSQSLTHYKAEDDHLSKEEIQQFEEENDILYSELNNLSTEVINIEGKVIEIGQLQEIFQEKVLAQSSQIENIHQTAITTTENVKEGNEQVRNAIKNSATFRVWILFFLVMCTFSLLFLDWYNY